MSIVFGIGLFFFGLLIGILGQDKSKKEELDRMYQNGHKKGFNEGFDMAFNRAIEEYDRAEKKLLGLEARFEKKYPEQGTYCCFLIHKPVMQEIKLDD